MFFKYMISLIKSIFFCTVFSFFFLISCTSAPPEQVLEIKSAQNYQIENNTDGKSLVLNKQEILEVNDVSGFVWAPFILPLQNYTQTNAALFLGTVDLAKTLQISNELSSNLGSNTFIDPPKEGECTLLVDSPILETDANSQTPVSTGKKLYQFFNQTKQKRVNTSLFFILDGQTHTPVAVARLNTKGQSKCFLPAKPYSITMGYGRYRNEIHVDGKSRTIKLDFPKVSALRVRPNLKNTNIKTGDIIRIGRKFNLKFTNKITDKFPEIHMGARIQPDLYINADMGSHDFSVDEYLKTSFLVGESNFQIELEPGNYVVAILRKSKAVCFNTLNLQPDSNFEISCPNVQSSVEEQAYQFSAENTIFDVGFRLPQLVKDKSFVNWTVSTPGAILLGPPLLGNNSDPNYIENLDSQNYFSIVYKPSPRSSIKQTSYGASISESIEQFKIPLKGMSKKQMLDGQVPFSEYILARSRKYLVPYFLNTTNVMYTNGAEISILEPVLTKKGSLFVTNEQEFMIRVVVPKWNSTRILEMHINGELYKRWILERDELKSIFSTTIKTNTYETKNFFVKFVTYGEAPLPNFLTGRESFLPYTETREFCVSLDGKEQCL